MIADVEPEASPLRRLVAFAATFFSMLTLASMNFARDPPLMAPPLVALMVLLAGVAGLLIWVKGRWSRAVLWLLAGVALVGGAGTALLLIQVQGVAFVAVLCGTAGLVAGGVAAAAIATQREGLRPFQLPAQWTVLVALLGLSLLSLRLGPGPTLATAAAAVALLLAWMLRPDDVEDDAAPA